LLKRWLPSKLLSKREKKRERLKKLDLQSKERELKRQLRRKDLN
jgi:hypothetical protein